MELSIRFNQALVDLIDDPQKRSWFKLFQAMDTDRSGRISYAEFSSMVRSVLGIDAASLAEDLLRSVFQALDDDGNGELTTGEFGAFMRQGETVERVDVIEARRQASLRARARHEQQGQQLARKRLADSELERRRYEAAAHFISEQISAELSAEPGRDSRRDDCLEPPPAEPRRPQTARPAVVGPRHALLMSALPALRDEPPRAEACSARAVSAQVSVSRNPYADKWRRPRPDRRAAPLSSSLLERLVERVRDGHVLSAAELSQLRSLGEDPSLDQLRLCAADERTLDRELSKTFDFKLHVSAVSAVYA